MKANRLTDFGRACLRRGGEEAVGLRFLIRSDSTNPRVLAKLAADMLLHYDRYEELGRAFDNCFEQGCGEAVFAQLRKLSMLNPALRSKIEEFGLVDMLDRAQESILF